MGMSTTLSRPARLTSSNGSGLPKPKAHKNGRLRVGVIGCGYWGPQVIRNYYEMAGVDLVGVADTRADRRDYVRRHFPRVRAFADHRALLDAEIDAVVVATPIQTHYELAREALERHKHVLVEKPLTSSLSDAIDLTRIAKERHLILMVGHTFLYNPAVQALRRIIDRGDLGRIYYADAARLNLGLFQQHVNVIWDLAPHDVSILLHVLQLRPKAVSARGSAHVQPGIHDVAYVELVLEEDVTAQIHVSWLDPCKVRRLTIVGNRKMVVYNDVSLAEKIRIYDAGVESPVTDNFGEFQLALRHGEMTVPYIPWQEPLRLQCEHFLECIRTGATPRTDAYQGLVVVAVLEAASRSLASGGIRVPVELPATFGPAVAPEEEEEKKIVRLEATAS